MPLGVVCADHDFRVLDDTTDTNRQVSELFVETSGCGVRTPIDTNQVFSLKNNLSAPIHQHGIPSGSSPE